MSTLSLVLYCEGSTDKYFLPLVIQRTSQYVLDRCSSNYVEALPVEVVEVAKQKQGRDILEASIKAYGRHVLVVHADADSRTYEQTRTERFEPGCTLVRRSHKQVCKDLIPLIPIREVEAWMIADHEALQEVLEISDTVHNLGVPKRAVLVESDPDPKITLNKVVATAESERRRKIDRRTFYESLALEIKLERLRQVPAYQKFVDELTEILGKLNIINQTYHW